MQTKPGFCCHNCVCLRSEFIKDDLGNVVDLRKFCSVDESRIEEETDVCDQFQVKLVFDTGMKLP